MKCGVSFQRGDLGVEMQLLAPFILAHRYSAPIRIPRLSQICGQRFEVAE